MPNQTRFLAVVALVGIVPLVLLGDTALAMLRGWELRTRLETLVIVVATTGLILLTLGVALPRGRRWLQAYGPRIGLLLMMFILALGIGEAVLQRFFRGTLAPAFHTRPTDWRLVFHPSSRIMPGVYGDARYTINSRGIRGPEMPPQRDSLRILCVGGSTTECAYLDDLEEWPHLLMRGLNSDQWKTASWVGNIGMSGYNTRHHLRFMQDSILLDEVDCVVLLVGVNDFLKYINTDKPEWNLQPDHLTPIWSRSLLLQLIRQARQPYHAIRAEDSAGRNYVLRRRERQQSAIVDELPDLTRGLDEFQRRIKEIIDVSRSRGVLLVFLTQPTLWDDQLSRETQELFWMGSLGNGKFLSVRMLQEGMRRYNEKLKSTCRDAGITCLDLDSMNGNVNYFYDCCHFNEAGARQVASIIVPAMIQYLETNWKPARMAGIGSQFDSSSRGNE